MNDDNVTFDDMQANRNNCNPVECLRCVHADMLQVERSYSCARCGCEKGRHFGTWAMGYPFAKLPFDACPDFAEVTDEGRKRMVNLAWEISCDRKRACSRPPGNHPVRIEVCHQQGRVPFPEVAASMPPIDGSSACPNGHRNPCSPPDMTLTDMFWNGLMALATDLPKDGYGSNDFFFRGPFWDLHDWDEISRRRLVDTVHMMRTGNVKKGKWPSSYAVCPFR